MTTQPEALRLADLLQDECGVDGYVLDESATELRRLHAECNDLARQLNESNERNGRLKAQRDALLAALRPFAAADLTSPTVRDTFGFDVLHARAAISAVEGGK